MKKFKYQKYWKTEVKEYVETLFENLDAKGLNSQTYYPTIYTFAENYNNFLLAQEIIATEGLLVGGKTGGKIANPAYSISTRSQNIFLSILKELGMSPKAQKYIKSEEKPEETPLDKLLGFASEIDR